MTEGQRLKKVKKSDISRITAKTENIISYFYANTNLFLIPLSFHVHIEEVKKRIKKTLTWASTRALSISVLESAIRPLIAHPIDIFKV